MNIELVRLTSEYKEQLFEMLTEWKNDIDNKYPCGDGGWIHYRVSSEEHFDNIKTLLSVKCSQ